MRQLAIHKLDTCFTGKNRLLSWSIGRRAELQPDPSRRLVVVFKGFIDTQGALAEGGIEKGLMDSSKNRVLLYEVSSQRDVQAALERLHAAGLKLDGLVIRAHSWARGAELGSESLYHSREWLKLKYFRDGASIVWAGCNTGAGGKDYENAGTNTRLVLSEQGESSKIRIFSADGFVSGGGTRNSQAKVVLGQKGEILDIIWTYRGACIETLRSIRPDVPNRTG